MTQVAFIGGGNMAASIIGGLVQQGEYSAQQIHVSDPNDSQRQQLSEQFGVHTYADNQQAIEQADVVMLAVKPQVMQQVLAPLFATLSERQPLIISIAAGIDMPSLAQWTGCKAIVRCMPNTPSLVNYGSSGLFASDDTNMHQRNLADSLMRAVGITVWVQQEQEIDTVIAVSGSGPAYYFLMMEAMIETATKMGMSLETATQLTLQTAAGAAEMAKRSDVDPAELRRRVTSPGGTTQQAIATFESAHLRDIVAAAMQAAQQRAAEMSLELGAQSEQ
ncbi:pyrroline-5-carboxylate reductase [Bacterioplanes sanyensis]|uniref:Pyrroline-5-carboxylate reductase n=1 Tax=Bacterioplanes sanyensis TaxID=1249553 RepID=A0A222FGD9_9GAMM|nr:pyrroline-5-carboxylate reductase [Bacterioplanes sanyensis]ASP38145.1 pyrroline-5-carboxylate reductase [Bacterioplanes sanyensis]